MTQHLGKGEEGAKGGRAIDHEALAHAHVNVIAGACMAIGLKVNHLLAYMPLTPLHDFLRLKSCCSPITQASSIMPWRPTCTES